MSSASHREAWAVAGAVALHVALLALPARRGVALLAEAPGRPLPSDVIELDTREAAAPAASLRKQDHDLGLDSPAGGVVATTIADVVRSSAIPGDARATFEVKVGAGGSVDSVRLLSSSAGDTGTWERVVRSAKGSLGGRAL